MSIGIDGGTVCPACARFFRRNPQYTFARDGSAAFVSSGRGFSRWFT
jgi:hypothetical protein